MSTTKVRDRELMMLSMTSSSVKVVGDWLKFAVVGIGKLEDDVLAFQGIMVAVHSAIGGTAGLELEVVVASSTLFFEEGCDDSRR
jgi:hypothetical protein